MRLRTTTLDRLATGQIRSLGMDALDDPSVSFTSRLEAGKARLLLALYLD